MKEEVEALAKQQNRQKKNCDSEDNLINRVEEYVKEKQGTADDVGEEVGKVEFEVGKGDMEVADFKNEVGQLK